MTYNVADNFRLTAGVRYSHDNKSRIGFTVRCGSVACNQPGDIQTPNVADRSFSKTTWRIGADFDLNDRTLDEPIQESHRQRTVGEIFSQFLEIHFSYHRGGALFNCVRR